MRTLYIKEANANASRRVGVRANLLRGCTVLCEPHSLTLSLPQSTYIGRDETGSVYLHTQLERTVQLYW